MKQKALSKNGCDHEGENIVSQTHNLYEPDKPKIRQLDRQMLECKCVIASSAISITEIHGTIQQEYM